MHVKTMINTTTTTTTTEEQTKHIACNILYMRPHYINYPGVTVTPKHTKGQDGESQP